MAVTEADATEFRVELSLAADLCFQAVDIINPAASSRFDGSAATVVGGGTRVRETWDGWLLYGVPPQTVEDWTLKFDWPGGPGQYQVSITGQMATAPGRGYVEALFRVNGKIITSQGDNRSPLTVGTPPFTWKGFDGWIDGIYQPSDLHQNPWLTLNTGDQVEVLMMSTCDTAGTFVFVPFECSQICFTTDPDAPASSYCTPTFDFPDAPLGDAWGSEFGWGGQKFVPDQFWPILGQTPYVDSPGNYAWGVNWTDYDFVALEDGTCYAIVHDAISKSGDTAVPGGATQRQYIVVKKYDPGLDDWTQINRQDTGNDYWNEHDPAQRYKAEAVSAELGENGLIYFTWWEHKTTTAGTPVQTQWCWHVVALDPSDDSTTELGTGQWVHTVGPSPYWVNYGESVQVNVLLPMANGDVYVASVEYANGTPTFDQHLYVWRWNGSTWTDLSVPDPSLTNAGVFECNGENSFYDNVAAMVAARHDEGPVTDGFTLTYPNTYFDAVDGITRFVGITIPYTVGSGWGTEIVSDWTSLLYIEQSHSSIPSDPILHSRLIAFDSDLLWSDLLGKLVFVADHVGGGAGQSWVMYQMNDDGDQWEPIENNPPSTAGAWRQGRNRAAIGPDGLVYRAMMSEVDTNINFLPRMTKHSPGYGAGWSNAIKSEIGQVTNKSFPWDVYMNATANVRLRFVGETVYIMWNLSCFSAGSAYGEDEYSDAIMVFKLSYNPCAPSFRPHFYRRVLG